MQVQGMEVVAGRGEELPSSPRRLATLGMRDTEGSPDGRCGMSGSGSRGGLVEKPRGLVDSSLPQGKEP